MILQPKHLLNEMLGIIKETFPKNIRTSSNIAKDLKAVHGNSTELHQVLLNLCVNARDAMPKGGTLTLTAENIEIDELYARMHPELRPGAFVLISVSDTGVGIPVDVRHKIFDPFFTTKEMGKGTGLGLSIVLGIVKSHGGFVNVYSEVGNGASFKVYLPAVESLDSMSEEKTRPTLHQGSGELVLIVDDEEAIREIVRATLETYGYRVMTASDGAEGITQFVQHQKDVAVVITDMMMPYMDGPSLLRALENITPNVKAIAISGLAEHAKITETGTKGNIEFLQKPFTTEKLLTSLSKVLNKK
jgi:hypothetical protein